MRLPLKIVMQLMLISLVLFSCQDQTTKEETSSESIDETEVEEIEHEYFYDIVIDTLKVEPYKVNEGEQFTDILKKQGFEIGAIFSVKQAVKDYFNIGNVKSGNTYYFIKDKNGIPHYFVYDINVTDYLVCKLGDDIEAYRNKNEVDVRESIAGGVISNDFYEALETNNIHESVGDVLVDIYGWSLDFYKLEKGDYFKLVFDEKVVDDKSVGVSEIKAAVVHHKGKDYYAFQYMSSDSVIRYYDKEGESIYGIFLKAPVKYGKITSRYNLTRFHPVEEKIKAHLGTDYAAPLKSPIRTTADGEILEVAYKKFNGNYVKVKHDERYTTGYLHMSETARGIKVGAKVKQGDVIGYVGTTGSSSGPHVCYRFWKNGHQVDHIQEKTKMYDPILTSDFFDTVFGLSNKLDAVDLY